MSLPAPLAVGVLLVVTITPDNPNAQTSDPTAAATIETSLSTSANQIRQFAFDGDPESFFASAENPTRSDHFTVVFDRAVSARSLTVVTGRADSSDRLDSGSIQTSRDGK